MGGLYELCQVFGGVAVFSEQLEEFNKKWREIIGQIVICFLS